MLIATAMPRQNKAEAKIHGEVKKPKQFLVTPYASERLDELAEGLKVSRSEYIERIIRGLALCNEEDLSSVYGYLGMVEEVGDEQVLDAVKATLGDV